MILKTFAAILLCFALSTCSGQRNNSSRPSPDMINWKNVLNNLPPQPRSGDEHTFDQILRANAEARSNSTGRSANDADFLFQGDIDMSFAEVKRLLSNNGATGRGKRAVMRKTQTNLWPRNIAYAFASNLNGAARRSIANAAAKYQQVLPCLGTWTDVTSTQKPRNYMYFFPGGGCYSQVGYKRGAQRVSIGRGCEGYGVVVHEIGHALGLWHEQSRPDRDSYVRIYTQNILRGMSYNFNKLPRSSVNSLGENYDYGSIMHYGPKAFSRNGRNTITKTNGQINFGQRRGLSKSDERQLQKLYGCTAVTTTKPTGCQDNAKHRTWCRESKGLGLCTNTIFKSYMASNCCATCRRRPVVTCKDKNRNCPAWRRAGYCTHGYVQYMTNNCPKSCRKCR